jgi:ectoine hydroxylase-related dioxygenase (phytanoyl-CoA dioxygenase family)
MAIDEHRVARAVADVTAHGWHIWENAFTDAECDELLEEIRALEVRRTPRSLVNNFHGHRTLRFYDLLNHGDAWQWPVTHDNLLPVVRGVLGEDCLLNTYGTSIILPGEQEQRIHVDDGPFIAAANSALRDRPHLGDGKPRRSIVCNTMIALCDFTEEIGATRVVPDSHTLRYPGRSEQWFREHLDTPRQVVAAEMPKGSILFFEGQCYHGGGANTTDRPRYAVTVDYCAGYLRTQENFLLSIPRERAASFSPTLQELIGLRISDGGLGHVYHESPDALQARVAMPQVPLFVEDLDEQR